MSKIDWNSVKKLEETIAELKESEKKFRTVFEGASDGILAADAKKKRFVFANPKICKITGYSLKELLKLNVSKIHPKKDLPYVLEQFKKQAQGKIVLAKNIPVLRKNKKIVYCDINSTPMKIGDQNLLVGFFRDISERKKAEELLFQSKVFEASITANSIADNKGNITHANPSFLKVWGFSNKKEVIGKPIHYLLQSKDDVRTIINALNKKGKWEGNYTAKRKDGSNFIAYGFATTIKDEKGNKIGYQSAVIDVTEQKKAEDELKKRRERLKTLVKKNTAELTRSTEALRESGKRFKRLFETSRDAIMTLTPPSWRFASGNPTTIKMFKTGTEKKFVSLGPWQLSPKYQPDGQLSSVKAKKMIMKAMKEGRNFFEWTHKRYKGGDFPATVLLSRIELSGKQFLQATVRDITERKKVEKKLKESEEKYRKQFEGALDAIFIADAKTGILIDCNHAGCELIEREKQEIIGKHQRILHPPEQVKGKFSETFKKHLKEKEGKTLEGKIITKKGEVKNVSIKANVFKLNDREVLQGMFRDITEQKKAENQLKKKMEEADNFSKFAVGRELKMVELKKKIKEMENKLKNVERGKK